MQVLKNGADLALVPTVELPPKERVLHSHEQRGRVLLVFVGAVKRQGRRGQSVVVDFEFLCIQHVESYLPEKLFQLGGQHLYRASEKVLNSVLRTVFEAY